MAGYAFIAPALICYLLLVAFPFCLTLILSFTEFNFLTVSYTHLTLPTKA